MSTQKQKFVYIFALVLSFALGMLTMSGCAYFSQEKVAGTVSTVLEIAYVAGGATAVEQRIDQMVTDGKITAEQAVQLKAAALKSYEELQKKLKELSEKALKQINDRKYDTELTTKGVKNIFKYGVAFSGKKVQISE